jgi:hypothetical protein
MKHIVERAIVPHNPSASSIINKEQYNLYAPVAGQGKVGMAAFDIRDFEVKNQTVSLRANVRDSVDKVLSLEADIIENTENISKNAGNITKNAGDIAINATNISTNTTAIGAHTEDIQRLANLIVDLQVFDTTHEKEFKDFVEAVNDLLDMSDTDLDEYREVLALIKSNKTNLQYLGTTKIDKDMIADDLRTTLAGYVLSANQGVILKNLITTLESALNTEVANRENAVTSEENARKAAIIEEANARSSADATHSAGIAALNARLDTLDLPIIQKPLYEHNISIYSYNPAETLPDGEYAVFRCTLYLPFEQTLRFNEIVSAIQTFQGKELGTDGERVDVLVGSYSGTVTIQNGGTLTTYPIDEAVVFDDNVWSLQLNSASGEYVLRYETATVYDVVRVVADVAEGGSGGVSSWNDLTDKPFGEEAAETFSASNKPHRESGAVFSMGTYGLVTDTVVPAVDELGSYSADVTFIYGEAQNTKSVTYVLSEFVVENLNGGYKLTKRSPVAAQDAIVFVVSDYATFIANYALEVDRNGIYAYRTEKDYSTPTYTSFADVTAIHKLGGIKKLDEKYIPDTIARVSDIPEGGSGVQIIRWEDGD